MYLYKVFFANNTATHAERVVVDELVHLKVEIENGRRVIKWFILFGESEADAIRFANDIAGDVLGKYFI